MGWVEVWISEVMIWERILSVDWPVFVNIYTGELDEVVWDREVWMLGLWSHVEDEGELD
jgi:hypothetical protein